MIEYGLNVNNNIKPKKSKSSLVTMFSAEVIDIILSKNHADYEVMGGNKSIGLIKYRLIESNKTTNNKSLSYAIPFQPNVKNYPIIGEIVLIYAGLPTSKTVIKESSSVNYYLSGINIFNNSHINNLEENKDFPVNSNHSPVLSKIGDIVTEGRFQNSLKFTSDDKGNPLTVIRNGRKSENINGDFSNEDYNNDDSLIIFSSNQPIDLQVVYNDLKSFNISKSTDINKITQIDIEKNNKKMDLNQVSTEKLTQVEGESSKDIKEYDEELVDYDLPKNEGSVDDVQLDEVIVQEHASITTQEALTETIDGREIKKLSKPLNLKDSLKHIGGLERDIPNHIKAIMEVLAYCEGTLGLNQNNGYDTVVLNCRTIQNWTKDYLIGCPYQAVYSKKGKLFQKGGHWGRYQYQKSTWVLDAGSNIAFSKRNQDLICAKTIKRRLGSILYDNLYNTMQDLNGVYKICSKLAPEWASIPNGNSIYSYYSNQHVRIYGENIQKLYNIAYKIYQK